MEHFDAQLDGIRLHIAASGAGDPVVLLHGFPEFWYSWRSQLPALAAAGFRALAPDLRGYGDSHRPKGIEAYSTERLVADIVQLIERVAGGNAHLVGHDWGGVIAWRLAAMRPDLVRKLVILNAPHPQAFRRVLRTNPVQWLQSSYVLLFQIPWLAERLVSAGDFWLMEQTFKYQPANPNAFTAADIARYKQAFRQAGAITAALNYYRAALRYPGDLRSGPQTVTVPTLVIWGDRDPYLSKQLTKDLDRWVTQLEVEHLPDASHWVQNDAPQKVNQLLSDFLSR
jgi:pimeloyl-ACP methyl ester carboxylesterase